MTRATALEMNLDTSIMKRKQIGIKSVTCYPVECPDDDVAIEIERMNQAEAKAEYRQYLRYRPCKEYDLGICPNHTECKSCGKTEKISMRMFAFSNMAEDESGYSLEEYLGDDGRGAEIMFNKARINELIEYLKKTDEEAYRIILMSLRQLPPQEIANKLGVKRTTAESKIKRAYKICRKFLEV